MRIPESTKASLEQRLHERWKERWPQLDDIRVRYRGNLIYVDGMQDGELSPLFRLRDGGSASTFGFAIYLGSKDAYEDSVLPDGSFEATPEQALDCACGLSLGDPSAWVTN